MDEPTTALARRWRAARGFGWIGGMLTTCYGRVREETSIKWRSEGVIRRLVVDDPDAELYSDFDGHKDSVPVPADALPDLDDPLTRMAALLMARKAWGDPLLYVETFVWDDGPRFRFRSWARPFAGLAGFSSFFTTEIEALIAALEAAPETP